MSDEVKSKRGITLASDEIERGKIEGQGSWRKQKGEI